jgi:fatty acid desaturase (delta-4 desaturase)
MCVVYRLWQIETSATWGGYWASFFTGGLCYQIEHHLFPGMAHNLYPEIAVIVKEECEKANVPYHGYGDIFSITKMTLSFLHRMGTEDSPTLSTKKIQ